MRQPKYKMGAKVVIPLRVNNSEIGYETTIQVTGTICGVTYDPASQGAADYPFYMYRVMPQGSRECVSVQEFAIDLTEPQD